MKKDEKLCWGKPSISFAEVGLLSGEISLEATNDDVLPQEPYDISFDIPATSDVRKLFVDLTKKRRFSRKFKKTVKKIAAKRFGLSAKRIKFSWKQ